MGFRAVRIINIPSDIGSVYSGKSRAPTAFKAAGLQEKLETTGWQVAESTALSNGPSEWTPSGRAPNGARNEAATVAACEEVRQAIGKDIIGNDESRFADGFQLILGGECLYCPSIMSAYWHHLEGTGLRIGLVYMDADCDLYTPTEPNSSGNIAGMTLTHLTFREGALKSMQKFSRADGSAVVDNTNIVLFGLNIDSAANKRDHLGYLFDNNFRVFTSRAVEVAAQEQAEAALKWLGDRVDYIILHLDVDVIDPGVFPLGNVPSWTGLGFEAAMAAAKTFLRSEKTIALSIAEVNPDHDPGLKMTMQLVDQIVDGMNERMTSGAQNLGVQ
ncbi:uncharacterized protein Z520_11022 [Fonsecaea multimorphosa CBS 102226]|uniref:Arginase n=1 Tax=Fonsecaea multimorphosa CBS 102226 TaxID=1442371 RepID=A0A0D2K9V0_9EURO|nr:uncharacterized protein Z520_11022 [Fonsecaea multimorphosa CBS 102226]KIX93168.1 hypothetical protein Z520_11022 [Fonsecaea multimorphosa CBS 102226]OAL17419.1 hypothetical protein AYO22_11642 [Fonsecaea multimorphosa]